MFKNMTKIYFISRCISNQSNDLNYKIYTLRSAQVCQHFVDFGQIPMDRCQWSVSELHELIDGGHSPLFTRWDVLELLPLHIFLCKRGCQIPATLEHQIPSVWSRCTATVATDSSVNILHDMFPRRWKLCSETQIPLMNRALDMFHFAQWFY